MTLKEIQELVKLINRSNLTEFKLKQGELELIIRTNKYEKGKSAAPAAPAQQPNILVPPVQSAYIPPTPTAAPPPAAPKAEPVAEKPKEEKPQIDLEAIKNTIQSEVEEEETKEPLKQTEPNF